MTKLVETYRSHEAILRPYSDMFYDGELVPKATPTISHVMCQWEGLPNKGFPLVFHGLESEDMQEGNSPSWFNPMEALQVQDIGNVSILLTQQVDFVLLPIGSQVCPGTEGQLHLCPEGVGGGRGHSISEAGGEDSSVARQGGGRGRGEGGLSRGVPGTRKNSDHHFNSEREREREREREGEGGRGGERWRYLTSCLPKVRSTKNMIDCDIRHHLGFLSNPKRFNVAISRAQALLIVVGNPHLLAKVCL